MTSNNCPKQFTTIASLQTCKMIGAHAGNGETCAPTRVGAPVQGAHGLVLHSREGWPVHRKEAGCKRRHLMSRLRSALSRRCSIVVRLDHPVRLADGSIRMHFSARPSFGWAMLDAGALQLGKAQRKNNCCLMLLRATAKHSEIW